MTSPVIHDIAELLSNWPANGKPDSGNGLSWARGMGFVRDVFFSEPCKSCGTPSKHASHQEIMMAGKLFLEAYNHTAREIG